MCKLSVLTYEYLNDQQPNIPGEQKKKNKKQKQKTGMRQLLVQCQGIWTWSQPEMATSLVPSRPRQAPRTGSKLETRTALDHRPWVGGYCYSFTNGHIVTLPSDSSCSHPESSEQQNHLHRGRCSAYCMIYMMLLDENTESVAYLQENMLCLFQKKICAHLKGFSRQRISEF